MSTQDHNRTISIAYGIIGLLMFVGLIIVVVQELHKNARTGQSSVLPWQLYFLPLPILQLLTSIGIFAKRRWARTLALMFSVLYVWIFPLGTALAGYTWWFLHSVEAKHLYFESSS